jgi:hypothetical protein
MCYWIAIQEQCSRMVDIFGIRLIKNKVNIFTTLLVCEELCSLVYPDLVLTFKWADLNFLRHTISS